MYAGGASELVVDTAFTVVGMCRLGPRIRCRPGISHLITRRRRPQYHALLEAAGGVQVEKEPDMYMDHSRHLYELLGTAKVDLQLTFARRED